jgi:hypothetical protein
MSRFVQGGDRGQVTLLPECLDHANAHSFCLPAFPLCGGALDAVHP